VINDVSGGLADPAMAGVAADAGCPWILMHWRGHSRDMLELAVYRDVVTDVRDELRERAEAAVAAGRRPRPDHPRPGLGFAKRADHNWALTAHLDVLTSWASRSSSAPAAKLIWAACSPRRTARPAGGPSARPPPSRRPSSRWPPGRGGAGARRPRHRRRHGGLARHGIAPLASERTP